MSEIAKLRTQLVKSTEQSFNVNYMSQSLENLESEDNCIKSSLMSFSSARTRRDSGPDSGISERSCPSGKSNSNISNIRTSSIPRPISSRTTATPSPTFSNSDDCTIQRLNTQIQTLKQELEKKCTRAPKVIEIHNELASLRDKFDKSERLNEYLRKQIEIYHITHGNLDSLLEMANKLNLTQEELAQYKDKLSKIQVISDSLPTSMQHVTGSNSAYSPTSKFNKNIYLINHLEHIESLHQTYTNLAESNTYKNLIITLSKVLSFLGKKFFR